ncbi:protein ACTIVITY OF BC1 COMPLEX KINASE 1, chloroplastic isoform X2 [Nicotiana sylvestris]|uniref:protein ACTIVITY OF BC1 COMPLEX KINASE 1, chloroplastic isoform X2 n=1 Tax=Nicotiana sylvestris TaxID=4096 RepID=UPI00388C7371
MRSINLSWTYRLQELKREEETLACALLFSLTSGYRDIENSMMYSKEPIKLEQVRQALNSSDVRRHIEGDRDDQASGLFVRGRTSQQGKSKSKHRSKSRVNKKNTECWGCGKKGHFERDCPMSKSKEKASASTVEQVLANRPDIIREDYMNELCILQDDVPAFPNQVAFNIIEEELGQPLEAVFSKISSETIAAASLGQVYRATLRASGEDVAIKVQRPQIEPIIYRDLFLFRTLASFLNGISLQKLGCNAELIVDEFGEKLLEELDYTLEARNIEDFLENFKDDPTVKIPRVYRQLSGPRVLVMEWIDGIRCTDPQAIREAGIDIGGFLTVGVSAALRQLLEFGLFHGDPHPGNVFAMRDGRIAYVDFGNVAVLSQQNKQILIDAVVHAVNEDYGEMANDFTRLGFLASGTDVAPIVPALEAIWQNSLEKGLADFNFRSVTGKFNQLVYNYPIRIPERFSLVIRSLLTQEGICLTLEPDFKFLEVAYPYVAKRLLTDPNPALRERLIQVLFKDGLFQWKRLENLITLAKENVTKLSENPAFRGNNRGTSKHLKIEQKLDLTDTIKDGARLFILDEGIRRQLLLALTEDSKLHIEEVVDVYRLLEDQVDVPSMALGLAQDLPSVARDILLSWSASVLSDR